MVVVKRPIEHYDAVGALNKGPELLESSKIAGVCYCYYNHIQDFDTRKNNDQHVSLSLSPVCTYVCM